MLYVIIICSINDNEPSLLGSEIQIPMPCRDCYSTLYGRAACALNKYIMSYD